MKIKKGDIFLTKKTDGLTMISDIITEADGGDYSHAITYIGKGRIIESVSGKGVKISSLKHYTHGGYSFKVKRIINKDKIPCYLNRLKNRIGDRYSYLQNVFDLVLFFLSWIFRKDFLKKYEIDIDPGAENCTELVGLCLLECGLSIGRKHPSFLTPKDIEEEDKVLCTI